MKKGITAGWNVSSTNGKAHYVGVSNGILNVASVCGRKSKKWYEAHEGDDKCLSCVSRTRDSSTGVQVHAGDFEKQELRVDFLQTVGPVIPLCWIPTDDIAAVVNLLKLYRPEDTMKVAQAQFDATINMLNKYVGDAIVRNSQPNSMTFTYNDKK
jgi:hypothetical protein